MEKKKKEELRVLELFRDHLPDFPKGILIPSESPDFVLSIGPRNKIGIELTRLHLHEKESDPYSFENISACLISKEEKLVNYRKKKYRTYWLVLVVPDLVKKPRYNLNNKLAVWEFYSGFDRVFLLHTTNGEIFELHLSA